MTRHREEYRRDKGKAKGRQKLSGTLIDIYEDKGSTIMKKQR